MMKLLVVAVGMTAGVVVEAADVPETWIPKPVVPGRSFVIMEDDPDEAVLEETATNGWRNLDWPMFAEAGRCALGNECVAVTAVRDRRDACRYYAQPIPGAKIREPLHLADFFHPGEDRETILREDPEHRPLVIRIKDGRPIYLTEPNYVTDREGFAAWRRSHPEFLGFRCMSEFDSDTSFFTSRVCNVPDAALRQKLLEAFPIPKDQYDWPRLVREGFRRSRELHFGCDEIWSLFSSCYSLAHLLAANGAKGLVYEATAQELARWQVAGAFLRGAARQFGKPYAWYAAHYSTSVRRGGTRRLTRSNRWWQPLTNRAGASGGPHEGESKSLFLRQCAYGWLIGAGAISVEEWEYLFTRRSADGVREANDWAREFNDFYVRAKSVDVGVPVTPLAILVPMTERNEPDGSMIGMGDRYSQNIFFNTLLPTGARDSAHREMRTRGQEGCLFNSPFGEIYDVLSPDAGQPTEDLTKALSAYSRAFLVGAYRPQDLDTKALLAYVRGGGTLIVSCDRLSSGLLGPEFADRSQWGRGCVEVVPVPAFTEDPDYRSEPPTDEEKRLATAFVYPPVVQNGFPADYRARLDAIVSGEAKFPLVKGLLEKAMSETMPIVVKGDVAWGVNRTKSGYHVWLMNNRGIEKFFGEPQCVDPSARVRVKIDLKGMRTVGFMDAWTGDELASVESIEVPAGGWRLISIRVGEI